jgi:FkbM family methyltransferase
MTLHTIISRFRFVWRTGADHSTRLRLIGQTIWLSVAVRVPSWYVRVTTQQKSSMYQLNVFGKSVVLHLRTQDLPMFYEVFCDECYTVPDGWLQAHETIVDFGAHVGLTAIWYTLRYGVTTPMYVVEASSKNMKVLSLNIAPYAHIQADHIAVAGHTGMVAFDESDVSYNHRIGTRATIATKHMPCITPSDFLKKHQIARVRVLKMDIEGAEAEVFAPECSTSWVERTDLIIMELHAPFDTTTLSQRLADSGKKVFQKGDLAGVRMVAIK